MPTTEKTPPNREAPLGEPIRNQIKTILLVENHPDWVDIFEDEIREILPSAKIISVNGGHDVKLTDSKSGKVETTSYRPKGDDGGKETIVNQFIPDLCVFSANPVGEENGSEIRMRLDSSAKTIFWTDLADDHDYLVEQGIRESDKVVDKMKEGAAAFRIAIESLFAQNTTPLETLITAF